MNDAEEDMPTLAQIGKALIVIFAVILIAWTWAC